MSLCTRIIEKEMKKMAGGVDIDIDDFSDLEMSGPEDFDPEEW